MSHSLILSPSEKSRLVLAIARDRDRESFRALFVYFAPRVKAYLTRLGTPGVVADELAQETLLAVWRKAESFDPARANASTWIFTIARNLRIDTMRRRGAREVPVAQADEEPAPDFPGDDVLSAERMQKVGKALTALPGDQAAVIRLSFFEEKPHPEIAAELGIPLGTVKSRLRLAMNRLRLVLEEIR